MSPETPIEKQVYQTPKLEQQRNFVHVTGVSVGIGASLDIPGVE
jgi:hypothetical protein